MTLLAAITTKYLGPTNARGSRIKATGNGVSHTVEWDHALNVAQNHTLAAKTFAERLGWDGAYFGGGLDNAGYVFVRTDAHGVAAAFTVERGV